MNKIKIFLILLICSLSLPFFVLAEDSFPDFPVSFYGTVKLNGEDIPVGSKIQAYAGTVLQGEVTITESGVYGYDDPTKIKLVVGSFAGNLTFKYVLSGSTPQAGCANQEYDGGFVSGISVMKNLAFNNTSCGVPISNDSSGGGGGGGGGGGSIACTSVIYSDWQSTCFNNIQYRSVLTFTPSGCSLTTAQQLAESRTCESATSIDSVLSQAASAESVANYNQQVAVEQEVLGIKVTNVTALEKKLTTKIDPKLIKRLAGRILLQVEQNGQAWYLDTISLSRFYLADGPTSYEALRKFGLGIKNVDLNKIPVALDSALPSNYSTSTIPVSSALVNRLKGRIVIQVENHGEAWYINPADGHRYYLANGDAAYQIMRNLSLGINDINIRKITVGSWE